MNLKNLHNCEKCSIFIFTTQFFLGQKRLGVIKFMIYTSPRVTVRNFIEIGDVKPDCYPFRRGITLFKNVSKLQNFKT